jgi:hypothetical protein
MSCIADGFWFKLGSMAAEIAFGAGLFLLITIAYAALVFFSRRGK